MAIAIAAAEPVKYAWVAGDSRDLWLLVVGGDIIIAEVLQIEEPWISWDATGSPHMIGKWPTRLKAFEGTLAYFRDLL